MPGSALATPNAIATPKFIAGIANRLIVETAGTFTAFAIESADMEWVVDDEDVTHSEALGWQSSINGIKRLNLTGLSFIYDLANNPLLAPYQFVPGMLVTLHLVLDANPTTDIPSPTYSQVFQGQFRMGPFKFSIGPKNPAVRVSSSAKSNGPMTILASGTTFA